MYRAKARRRSGYELAEAFDAKPTAPRDVPGGKGDGTA